MRAFLLPALLVISGCTGSDPAAPAPVYSMAGTWAVAISFTGPLTEPGDPSTYTLTCAGTATFTMDDPGAGPLSGTSAGVLNCGGSVYTMNRGLSGSRDGSTVNMTDEFDTCVFTGSMTTAKAASGAIHCDYDYPGLAAYHLAGTWSATR